MIKILITDKLAQEGIDLLKTIDGVEPVVKTGISEDELASIIGDHDGLIIRSGTQVTAKVLANPGKLKGIARAGVGVDNIDVPEATKKGILVMNTPGGNTLSAAEHTLALMLGLSRNIAPACQSLKEGKWDRKLYSGNQLNNKVLGVIGLGRIGMAVAKMATGFDMKILGYDPIAAPAEADSLGIEVVKDLERVFKESDYITVHVPKNEKTIDLIDADQLAMMKPTVRLINTARGGIINEDALYDALASKKVAGAALDVFPKEPPTNTRFTEFVNCLVTPHLGASTQEAQVEVAVEAAQELVDAIKGGSIKNAINAPSISGKVPLLVTKYSELAKRIGNVIASITDGPIKSVDLQFRGEIAEMDIKLVKTSFTIGLLQASIDAPVNMVNVELIAKERGINIDETINVAPKDFSSSLTAVVATDKVSRSVTGTVFGGELMRVIDIDGFKVEMTPSGTVMVVFNDDKPGVVGAVGKVVGEHEININTMGVGQKPEQKKAVLAVSLDKCPDTDMIKAVKALEFVNEVHLCRLD